ncbi:MAG: 4,5-DOPA dioxygenase extradiol [Bdellovibrionia bacterium]
MPVLFFGHGSPMNAISDNAYTRTLARVGRELPKPRAILCVSAHWMTEGTWVTGMDKPRTIHDFSGFPEDLFKVQYPAPGDPETAKQIASLVSDPKIHIDQDMWGLDHGTWAVLRHMYPNADVPALQLSIYLEQSAEYHYLVGQQLRALREQGILIVGSGNIVHNLRRMRWEDHAKPYDWAVEFDEWVKTRLVARDDNALIRDYLSTAEGKLSVPTPDHYFPLLTILGAAERSDELKFLYEGVPNGSISMRSLRLG